MKLGVVLTGPSGDFHQARPNHWRYQIKHPLYVVTCVLVYRGDDDPHMVIVRQLPPDDVLSRPRTPCNTNARSNALTGCAVIHIANVQAGLKKRRFSTESHTYILRNFGPARRKCLTVDRPCDGRSGHRPLIPLSVARDPWLLTTRRHCAWRAPCIKSHVLATQHGLYLSDTGLAHEHRSPGLNVLDLFKVKPRIGCIRRHS